MVNKIRGSIHGTGMKEFCKSFIPSYSLQFQLKGDSVVAVDKQIMVDAGEIPFCI